MNPVHLATGNGNAFNVEWNENVRPVFCGISLSGVSDVSTAKANPSAAARLSVQRHGIATVFKCPTAAERAAAKFAQFIKGIGV